MGYFEGVEGWMGLTRCTVVADSYGGGHSPVRHN